MTRSHTYFLRLLLACLLFFGLLPTTNAITIITHPTGYLYVGRTIQSGTGLVDTNGIPHYGRWVDDDKFICTPLGPWPQWLHVQENGNFFREVTALTRDVTCLGPGDQLRSIRWDVRAICPSGRSAVFTGGFDWETWEGVVECRNSCTKHPTGKTFTRINLQVRGNSIQSLLTQFPVGTIVPICIDDCIVNAVRTGTFACAAQVSGTIAQNSLGLTANCYDEDASGTSTGGQCDKPGQGAEECSDMSATNNPNCVEGPLPSTGTGNNGSGTGNIDGVTDKSGGTGARGDQLKITAGSVTGTCTTGFTCRGGSIECEAAIRANQDRCDLAKSGTGDAANAALVDAASTGSAEFDFHEAGNPTGQDGVKHPVSLTSGTGVGQDGGSGPSRWLPGSGQCPRLPDLELYMHSGERSGERTTIPFYMSQWCNMLYYVSLLVVAGAAFASYKIISGTQ
jgi:hypothetical protein